MMKTEEPMKSLSVALRPLTSPGHVILGHLPALHKDPLNFLLQCSREHGPVVPLRLPFLRAYLLTDSADIERVLVTDHRNFVKPLWLRTAAVRRLLGDGLVNSDGDNWKRQHDECQPAFHPAMMEAYGQTIIKLAERSIAAWAPGETRNIQHDMARLTLEIVVETMFGANTAVIPTDIGDAMDTVMESFGSTSSVFGLMPRIPSQSEIKAMRRLDTLIDTLIAGESHHAKLLSNLGGTKKQVRDQVKTFLAAGHESSALALTWAFLLMAERPEVESKLASEIQDVIGDRTPVPSDTARLVYANAVIKETLRLYPPLWMTGRKAIKPIELHGHKIKAGSLLLTSQWAVQRSPKYFTDPDAFRPERWLSEETSSLPRFAYFPFGGGPRTCIGQNFAVMESVLILTSIIQKFKLEMTEGNDTRPMATMTLRPTKNLRMTVEVR